MDMLHQSAFISVSGSKVCCLCFLAYRLSLRGYSLGKGLEVDGIRRVALPRAGHHWKPITYSLSPHTTPWRNGNTEEQRRLTDLRQASRLLCSGAGGVGTQAVRLHGPCSGRPAPCPKQCSGRGRMVKTQASWDHEALKNGHCFSL